nr:hypothetical protein [Burkholderia stagnalis]
MRGEDGTLLLGRADDHVKINGYRIELGDVEAHLRALDNVADAAATVRRGLDGRAWGLEAHLVLRDPARAVRRRAAARRARPPVARVHGSAGVRAARRTAAHREQQGRPHAAAGARARRDVPVRAVRGFRARAVHALQVVDAQRAAHAGAMTPGAAPAKVGELGVAAPSRAHTWRNDNGVLFVPYGQVDAAAAAACDARLAADSAWLSRAPRNRAAGRLRRTADRRGPPGATVGRAASAQSA